MSKISVLRQLQDMKLHSEQSIWNTINYHYTHLVLYNAESSRLTPCRLLGLTDGGKLWGKLFAILEYEILPKG